MVGTEEELLQIMQTAKWYKAAALGLESDLKIAVDSVLSRPDDNAPVSSLYLFGRKEDLAFEQPVGDNPRHRHHVRFWKTDKRHNDRPVWVGSAIYDQHVGFSRDTGQITHVTAPDIDAERDYMFRELERTGDLATVEVIDDFHKILEGRNGGGDPWHTDGRLFVGAVGKEK
jgi:LssY-like putative type I secretion system component LssY